MKQILQKIDALLPKDDDGELKCLRGMLDARGLKAACLESGLAEAHLPDAERAAEADLTLAFENCGVATWEVKSFIEALGGEKLWMAWDVKNGWFTEQDVIEIVINVTH